MSGVSSEVVRSFILDHVASSLDAKGLAIDSTPPDFDLLLEGVIDSFGLIELIGALEARFNLQLDFEQLDPDTVTVVGPLAAYVADQATHNN